MIIFYNLKCNYNGLATRILVIVPVYLCLKGIFPLLSIHMSKCNVIGTQMSPL